MDDKAPTSPTVATAPKPVRTRAPGFTIPGAPDTVLDSGVPTMSLRGQGLSTRDPSPESIREGDRYSDAVEIGRGGMGRVYKVKDQDLNRNIAMKVLAQVDVRDSVERFIAEAQISGQLEHPSLLPIHDFGVNADGEAFFTMRYVPHHRTLHEVIHRLRFSDQEAHDTYTFEYRVQIIQRVCDALTYAHQRGVIHRDIKPSNIIIGDTGEVYLADWGLAQLLIASRNADNSVDSTIALEPTGQGEVAGTPLYMSPEQLLGEGALAPASDVYSLCAVAYEFLSLRHYLGDIESASFYEILDTTVFGERKDAESHFDPQNGRVPRHLSRILRKGLQIDRGAGIQSSQELHDLLQQWAEGKAPVVCPGTFLQHWLGRLSRSIDRWPVLAPTLIVLSAFWAVASVLIAGAALAGILG